MIENNYFHKYLFILSEAINQNDYYANKSSGSIGQKIVN